MLQAHTVIIQTNTDCGPGRGWSLQLAINELLASLLGYYVHRPCFPAEVVRKWKCQVVFSSPGLMGKQMPPSAGPGSRGRNVTSDALHPPWRKPGQPALSVHSLRPPLSCPAGPGVGEAQLSYWSFCLLVMWFWASDSSSVT